MNVFRRPLQTMGQLDPDNPLVVGEGMMDVTPLVSYVHIELHTATQAHHAPQTINVILSKGASLRGEIAVVLRRRHGCEMTAVGSHGAAEQQYQYRVQQELAAIQIRGINRLASYDVIRMELQEQVCAQGSTCEARVRAECAVVSADNTRQRTHREIRCYLIDMSVLPSFNRPKKQLLARPAQPPM